MDVGLKDDFGRHVCPALHTRHIIISWSVRSWTDYDILCPSTYTLSMICKAKTQTQSLAASTSTITVDGTVCSDSPRNVLSLYSESI